MSISDLLKLADEKRKAEEIKITNTESTSDYRSVTEYILSCLQRKRNVLLKSELELIQEWEKRGIPLHVVLSAINRCLDRIKLQRLRFTSLDYCKEEVETAYYYYREFAEKVSPVQTDNAEE